MKTGYRFDEAQHVHLLNGKPLIGASTAKSILGKGDGLIQWAAGCAVDHIEKNEVGFDGAYHTVADDVLQAARTAWKTTRDAAATKGTERHGRLEDYALACLAENDGKPLPVERFPDFAREVKAFIAWSVEKIDRFVFTEANAFSSRLHVGGIADVGLQLKDGRRLVGDHKSSRKSYPDQVIQAVIYDILLSENGGLTDQGDKVFDWKPADGVVIFPFRSSPFTPEFFWNMDELRAAAEETIHLYKVIQKMSV